MSQRKISLAVEEYYHIYNRGNSKQIIFRDTADYVRFQQLLYVMNSTEGIVFKSIDNKTLYTHKRGDQLVAIGAYCQMPNHFHILLTPCVEHGVQIFMQKLLTGYSLYFNKRHERTGGLFEGRFKSRHVSEDAYLKYLFSYIHLNPIKLIQPDWKDVGIRNVESATRYLNSYAYSSFLDYVGTRKEGAIIESAQFPEYFIGKKGIDAELLEWLMYREYVESST